MDLVQAPLFSINVEEPWVAIIVEKQKVIFLLDLHFCHSFLIVPETPVPCWDGIYISTKGSDSTSSR
jgi:hypothetical protein